MKSIHIYILVIFLFAFFSCTENEAFDQESLSRASHMVEQNPTLAIAILDSIDNLNTLSRDDQMSYIVLLVQAKNKLNMDVSKDTLIFQAQQYYNERNDLEKAILANICAGAVYNQKKQPDLAIKSFLKGCEFAEKKQDNLSLGKTYNNIGFLFFQQDLMDSAVVYYQKALSYFDQTDNADKLKLKTLKFLGSTYDAMNQPQNAYIYFQQGLDLSKSLNDLKSQSKFSHFIGLSLKNMGRYNEALEYYDQALVGASSNDSLLIYLAYSKLYNAQNRPKEAKAYIGIIKNRLGEIEDNYILQSIYTSLSDYYKQIGDYETALFYTEQKIAIGLRIVEQNQALNIVKAKQEQVLESKDSKIDELNYQIKLFLVVIALIVILFARIIWMIVRADKKKQDEENQEMRVLSVHFRSMKQLSNMYDELLTEVILLNERINQSDNIAEQKEEAILLRQNFDQNLIQWAKNNFEGLPFQQIILDNFSDDEILLLMLNCYKYSELEISAIIVKSENDIKINLQKVEQKLKKFLTDSEIKQLLSVGSIPTPELV